MCYQSCIAYCCECDSHTFLSLISDQPAPSPSTAAPAATQHTPALVQRYIDYLKDRYINKSLILKEKLLLQPKEFIRLNLVSNTDQEDSEFKSDCLLLKLYGDVAAMKKKRRPMEMENIGRSEDQSVAQHILVEGSPGIGKTIFSWELCRQWAKGKMLQDRDIVLMLQLRRKYVREAKSLSDLFHHDDNSIKQEVLHYIKSIDGKGVFLVLEGYDELTEDQRTEGSILNRLLIGDCLSKASIMVTSRPLASDSLCPEFMKSVDQHIEVVGFNDENIKSYVKIACQKQPKVLPDLMSYIVSNPFVSSIMYIPLQCAILTGLYIEKWRENKGKAYAPTTLTQLYTDLLLSSLIRYISDHPVYSKCKTAAIRQLSDLPSEVQEQVWKLSQLAAEGLENRQFIFNSIPCDHMGLMQSAEERVIGSSVSYCFLHLTLQEYLAALHWSRMGSEDMVRLVSDTSLFPLDTLVRDGITETAGHHWPALYFLSGLTSVPFELLNISLKAGDEVVEDGVIKETLKILNKLVNTSILTSLTTGNNCNPYFFQMLFETQSCDLISKLFFRKRSVTTTITNPLECFVTAWCVANSDPTSQWKFTFENFLILENFVKHCMCFAKVFGSKKTSYDKSVVGIMLNCTQQHLIISQHASEELVRSLALLFPGLEFLGFFITPAGIAQAVPLLCIIHKLVSLKMLTIKTVIMDNKLEDEFPAICIPPLHCPSLKSVWLWGKKSVPLIQSLILPNINTITTIALTECRPRSGSEFNNFCSCLCQSTSLLECLIWKDVDLSTPEKKELICAMENINSLKVVSYDDDAMLTDVGIQQLKQVMSSSTVTYNEKKINDELRKLSSRPLHSLITDHGSVQKLVTENPTLSLQTKSGRTASKKL